MFANGVSTNGANSSNSTNGANSKGGPKVDPWFAEWQRESSTPKQTALGVTAVVAASSAGGDEHQSIVWLMLAVLNAAPELSREIREWVRLYRTRR
jgi:hypothetical protein